MVFEKIQFIRGILVSDAAIRVLIGERYPELWDEFQREVKSEQLKNPPEEKDEVFQELWIDWWPTFRRFLEQKIGLEIHTWPCCSPLNRKKFVFGFKLKEVKIAEIFNNVIDNPKIIDSYDKQIVKSVQKYQMLDPDIPKTIMILDDCLYCS